MLLRSFAMTACLALAACSSTSTGGDPFMATSATGTEGGQKERKAAQLAQCAQPIGTVSLVEKEIPALEGTGLTSPTTVMRLMITQSNCFQIVDADHPARRGKRGAQADYFLTADVISKNENAGGVDWKRRAIPAGPVRAGREPGVGQDSGSAGCDLSNPWQDGRSGRRGDRQGVDG